MPDAGYGVELVRGPEAGEVMVGKQADEGVVVVLIDGFKCVFGLGGVGRGVGYGEDFVGVTPFLGEVGPGNGRSEEADGGGEGGR